MVIEGVVVTVGVTLFVMVGVCVSVGVCVGETGVEVAVGVGVGVAALPSHVTCKSISILKSTKAPLVGSTSPSQSPAIVNILFNISVVYVIPLN